MAIRSKKSNTPEKQSVLSAAHSIIYGDREKTYGSPDKNLNTIADFWSIHLNAKYGTDVQLTSEDVCGMMILLKQARLGNDPGHIDSLTDICGYAALQERVQAVPQ